MNKITPDICYKRITSNGDVHYGYECPQCQMWITILTARPLPYREVEMPPCEHYQHINRQWVTGKLYQGQIQTLTKVE